MHAWQVWEARLKWQTACERASKRLGSHRAAPWPPYPIAADTAHACPRPRAASDPDVLGREEDKRAHAVVLPPHPGADGGWYTGVPSCRQGRHIGSTLLLAYGYGGACRAGESHGLTEVPRLGHGRAGQPCGARRTWWRGPLAGPQLVSSCKSVMGQGRWGR